MCGLLYGWRRDKHPVLKSLKKRYEKQKNRGTQGFGCLTIDDSGRISQVFRSTTEYFMFERLGKEVPNEFQMLFHHRYPTSTENLAEMTHPIIVDNPILQYKYYIIHNGVLQNEDELKEIYNKMGFEYTTEIVRITSTRIGKNPEIKVEESSRFNDSESLAIDIALTLEGKQEKILSKGTIAFICLQATKDDKAVALYWGHNDGNPLVLENNNDIFFIKSTGSGEDVPVDTLFRMDYTTHNITSKEFKVGERKKYEMGYSNEHTHKQKDVAPKYLPPTTTTHHLDMESGLFLPDESMNYKHLIGATDNELVEWNAEYEDDIEHSIATQAIGKLLGYGNYDDDYNYNPFKEKFSPLELISQKTLDKLQEEYIRTEADKDDAASELAELRKSSGTGADVSFYENYIKEMDKTLGDIEQAIEYITQKLYMV